MSHAALCRPVQIIDRARVLMAYVVNLAIGLNSSGINIPALLIVLLCC